MQAQVVDYPVTTLVNAALELAWRSYLPVALDATLDRVRAAQRHLSSAPYGQAAQGVGGAKVGSSTGLHVPSICTPSVAGTTASRVTPHASQHSGGAAGPRVPSRQSHARTVGTSSGRF